MISSSWGIPAAEYVVRWKSGRSTPSATGRLDRRRSPSRPRTPAAARALGASAAGCSRRARAARVARGAGRSRRAPRCQVRRRGHRRGRYALPALVLEALERLANRHPARVALPCDRLLADPLARAESPFDDLISDPICDPDRKRAGPSSSHGDGSRRAASRSAALRRVGRSGFTDPMISGRRHDGGGGSGRQRHLVLVLDPMLRG